jgi:carboxylate-amine ligase
MVDQGGLWESRFGHAPPFSVGVEEELLLVGADNELADQSARIIRDTDTAQGDVDRELFKAMIESRSEISASVAEALGTLRDIRRELLESGARIIGAGIHPNASAGESDVHQTHRYSMIEELLQGVLRTPICGQHVHVGMPDQKTAVRSYNGIRTHVPLINALASNSPFWFGVDSGLASARTVLFRSYPRAAMAPQFDDYQHFCRVTQEVCLAGGLDDYSHIWWDARIHPGLGTIEVRAADTQFDLRRAAAIAALVHCLVRVESERDQDDIPSREALAESSFQATRYGLDAQLLSRAGSLTTARDLGRACLEKAMAFAPELGCEGELRYVATMLEEGSGADLQRRAHADGGMEALLSYLLAETARL